MKRFWTAVATAQCESGWEIRLDERPLRTPARVALVVPEAALADAIASEWAGCADEFMPGDMPLTGLANAAIDRIQPARGSFAAGLAAYGESDLLCYRATTPQALVERQAAAWDPILAWARRRYDIDFATTVGVVHRPQPRPTVERLAHAVHSLDSFRLAGLSPLVTVGGSLITGLAVLERALSADEAWDATSLDEQWQLEQWGPDSEAEAALGNRRRAFMAGASFLALLD